MTLLDGLTRVLVGAGGVGACEDEPWLHDCTDMLLDVSGFLLGKC